MIRVLYDILQAASAAQPQKTAVFWKRDSMTYGEVDAAARGVAGTLLRFGVRKGDRVCVYLEKGLEEVISFWGTTLAGGVFVPIRPGLTTGQAAHILEDSGAVVLVTDPGRASALREQTPVFGRLSLLVCGGGPDGCVPLEEHRGGLCSWNEAVSGRDSETGSYSRVIDTDLATILYTSGSTGKPKGVVLSHLNVVEGSKRVSQYLAITEDDRLLSILSFGFDYGLNQLTTAFLHRAQIVLFDPVFPKHVIDISHRMDVTGIAAVSTTWMQLLQAPWDQSQLPCLRYITNSGGAIPREGVLELRRRLPRTSIFLMYGLTEAFRSTYLDPGLIEQYPTSIGRAIPGEEILVLDESGRPVQEGPRRARASWCTGRAGILERPGAHRVEVPTRPPPAVGSSPSPQSGLLWRPSEGGRGRPSLLRWTEGRAHQVRREPNQSRRSRGDRVRVGPRGLRSRLRRPHPCSAIVSAL